MIKVWLITSFFILFLSSAARRCMFTGVYTARVSWRLPLHGGFMLSFHHLVWKNRKHLKDENNITLLQFSEISDLVRRVCKTIEIQSEWIKNDRMTEYQEVVMILIGSMAIRVSNEDGSRKFATLARDWHPPNHVSCFFGWKQVEARHYAIWYTIYIYIYPPTGSKHALLHNFSRWF